jgi:hypothetical protein
VLAERIAKAVRAHWLDTMTNFGDYLLDTGKLEEAIKNADRGKILGKSNEVEAVDKQTQSDVLNTLYFSPEQLDLDNMDLIPDICHDSSSEDGNRSWEIPLDEAEAFAPAEAEVAPIPRVLPPHLRKDVSADDRLKHKEGALPPAKAESVPIPRVLPPNLRKDVTADDWLKQEDRDLKETRPTTDTAQAVAVATDANLAIPTFEDFDLSDEEDDLAKLISAIQLLAEDSDEWAFDLTELVVDESGADEDTTNSTVSAAVLDGEAYGDSVSVNCIEADGLITVDEEDPWADWKAKNQDIEARCDPNSPKFDPQLLYMPHLQKYHCTKCR